MITVKEVKKNRAKQTFGNLFIILVVALMVLPFLTTFNEFLTSIVLKTSLYYPIEKWVVPYETLLVRTILGIFGVETTPGTVAVIKNGVPSGIYIAWNCIGWQSFIILLVSLKAGWGGEFSKLSRLESAVVGILGTFLINIFRIATVVIIFYYFGKAPATIFHDYSSVIITILWLFFFWWFAYKYVLEEKIPVEDNKD